jgi:hypothetical protein
VSTTTANASHPRTPNPRACGTAASALTPREMLLVDAIAARLHELLRLDAHPSGTLVDAQTLAVRLGVSRAYVYRHRRELGGVKIGGGTKPRVRFDLATALQAHGRVVIKPQPARAPTVRRRPVRSDVPLLPIRGDPS